MRRNASSLKVWADATGALTEQMKVGRVNVADELKDTVPGDYVADFKLFVSRDGELVARIVSLKALNASRVAPLVPPHPAKGRQPNAVAPEARFAGLLQLTGGVMVDSHNNRTMQLPFPMVWARGKLVDFLGFRFHFAPGVCDHHGRLALYRLGGLMGVW